MTLSTTAAGLFGAGIGAGGAVLAQIAAQIFSGRHETKRLAWEKKRQDRDERLRRDERFADLKRQLYAEYLHITNGIVTEAIGSSTRIPIGGEPRLERLGQINSEIMLVGSSEVRELTAGASLQLVLLLYGTPGQPRDWDDVDMFNRIIAGVRDAMRRDLAGQRLREPSPVSQPAQVAGLTEVTRRGDGVSQADEPQGVRHVPAAER